MPYTPGTDLDGLQVTLGALRLGAVDASGVAWRLKAEDGLQGWDSADIRSELQERESDHGAWPSPVYLGARPITLAGTVVAPDRTTLDAALERIRAAAALTDTALTVHETIPKMATVRRSGQVMLAYLTDRAASFSVMVTAADPRRYGTDLREATTGLPTTTGGLTPPLTPPLTVAATTVAGQILAHNEGTFASRPVLVIDGPVSQPRILAQQADGTVITLAYGQDLDVGDQLVIDTDARSVVLGGTASRRRWLTAPRWPEIPAESSVTFLFRADTYDPTATLTARWRPAWI